MDAPFTSGVALAILATGFLIGLTVWVIAFTHYVRTLRRARRAIQEAETGIPEAESAPLEWITGERKVSVSSGDLRARLKANFSTGPLGTLYSVEEHGQDEIHIRYSSEIPMRYHPLAAMKQARLRLRRGEGAQTIVRYAAQVGGSTRGLSVATTILLTLGLFAVLALPMLLWFLCANNPNGAIRAQSIQVLQMIHFLWPPFLTTSLLKRSGYRAQSFLEIVLTCDPDTVMNSLLALPYAGRRNG
ncbi:MAG TPA: hypothetical protein PL033_07790 [Candidatus Brocadiia bacterium]|nr:hypothetical protein [Candidatus Brocadiia bacterium]